MEEGRSVSDVALTDTKAFHPNVRDAMLNQRHQWGPRKKKPIYHCVQTLDNIQHTVHGELEVPKSARLAIVKMLAQNAISQEMVHGKMSAVLDEKDALILWARNLEAMHERSLAELRDIAVLRTGSESIHLPVFHDPGNFPEPNLPSKSVTPELFLLPY